MESSTQTAGLTTSPRLNTEVYHIPLDDNRFLIYAPLRRTALIADNKTVAFLDDLKAGRDTSFNYQNITMIQRLRHLGILDAAPEQPSTPLIKGSPLPTAVTLFLTTACNLRCTYCYAKAGDSRAKFMSLATAKRGIDFVSSNRIRKNFVASNQAKDVVPHFIVSYHGGGEPTMNWKVLTGSFEYAQQRAADLDLTAKGTLATNGVLKDSQIDWIIDHLESLSLSFDGLPILHDRHRPTISGMGSSKPIMHTLRRFDAAGFRYRIRITVTEDQVSGLADSVEFITRHFSPAGIHVEPVYPVGRWKHTPSDMAEQFILAFREAHNRAKSRGYSLDYSPAHLDKLTSHYCGITQDSFALTPDGNVSACYAAFSEDDPFADIFLYGQPKASGRGYQFNLPALDNLRQQTVEHRSFCQDCFAKWHCAGDCLHASLEINGKKEFTGSDRCHITRELVKDKILARINSSGGQSWQETTLEQRNKTLS